MKVLYLVNNLLGLKIGRWLAAQAEDDVIGLVMHPEPKQKYGDAIKQTFNLPTDRVFEATSLRDPKTLQAIKDIGAEVALSVLFGYILKPDFIDLFPRGVINLHPSYLPYNRGAYPNVWSIVDETPSGVTLHHIDTGIDTGDIIAQKQIEVSSIDTGKSLYDKLEILSYNLFTETWPQIRSSQYPTQPQAPTQGTYHRTSDVENIDKIDLDERYTARELINILRARTFPPYKGAYFIDDSGRRVNLHLDLQFDDSNKSIDNK